MTLISVQCGSCLFWIEDSAGGSPPVGACHRYPPAVLGREPGKRPSGAWPAVNAEEFCGEFLEVIKEEEMTDD